MTPPASLVKERCGVPNRRAVQCAFERFEGMSSFRQTSKNFLRILIPFLEDEGDTWINSGLLCVALHCFKRFPKDPDFEWYAQTRGGIWNTISLPNPPYYEVHSLREVIHLIDEAHNA